MSDTAQAMPNHPHATEILDLIAKGISLRQEKRHEEALECLDQATSIDPKFFPVLVERGIILFELTRYGEAIECFDLFLRYSGNPQVRQLRDTCLKHALASCENMMLKSHPSVELLLKRGSILQRLHRYDDAVYTYNFALEIYVANMVNVINRRGNSLLYLNKPEDALESYNRALELAPNNAFLLFNRAQVMQKLGRMHEALEGYGRALEQSPDLPEAKMERGHCMLAMGNYQEGFREYESRWETAPLKAAKLKTSEPLWLGKENLAGKTILLWAEQGFGDTIQFMRYVPLVAPLAGKTILRVPTLMLPLAQTLDCNITIITFGDLPRHDFNSPLMSLPLALGTTTETIPARIPYLSAQPDQIEKWRNQLGPRTRPRIGLAWAGRRVEPINRTRDMALASLHPLTRLDVDLISLQKEIPEQDMALLNTMPQISRLGESVSDFSDTAALIENLDLVISVDSAVTHLSGALGKPVWIMLRHSSEWRWFLKRTDSPWYPTARIFRQKAPGDWSGVVSDIVEQLQDLIVRHKQDSSGLGQVCTGESHEGDAPECRP